MQKRSVTGGSTGSSSAADAMAALTMAVRELQTAMTALAGLLQQGSEQGRGDSGSGGEGDLGSGPDSDTRFAGGGTLTDSSAGDEPQPYRTLAASDYPSYPSHLSYPSYTGVRGHVEDLQRAALDERDSSQLYSCGSPSEPETAPPLPLHPSYLGYGREHHLTPPTSGEEPRAAYLDQGKAADLPRDVNVGARTDSSRGDALPELSVNRPERVWTTRDGERVSGRSPELTEGDAYPPYPSYPTYRSHSHGQEDSEDYPTQGDARLTLSHSLSPPLPDTERLAEAIGRLADAILNGGGRSGSGAHPGEAQGGLNGLLRSAAVGTRPNGYN